MKDRNPVPNIVEYLIEDDAQLDGEPRSVDCLIIRESLSKMSKEYYRVFPDSTLHEFFYETCRSLFEIMFMTPLQSHLANAIALEALTDLNLRYSGS